MKPAVQFLSEGEVEQIHRAALTLLETVGFRFPLEAAREALRKAGATIESDCMVKLPAALVNHAVERAPRRDEVTLFGREPAHDVTFTSDEPVMACMTMAVHVIDPHTGRKRPATEQDQTSLLQLADELDQVRINGALVTAQDVPGEVNDWHTWAAALKNTTKHITGGFHGEQCVRDAAAMAALACGGEEAFRKRPCISGWVLTLPPLAIDDASLSALLDMGRLGIPAMVSSGPTLGVSGPVTLAGTLAQAHAEILACLTLAQVVHPGTPVVYTSFARGVNMRTGDVSMASPEFGILKGALAQMGRFLGLPTRMPAMLRDAKLLDAQAGFETGMVGTVGALSADIIDAMQLDMDLVVDFADLAFCNDCMAALIRLTRPLVVTDETLALEVIGETGAAGCYLSHFHTVKHFRQELWQPQLMERRSWDQWEAAGAPDIRQVARQQVLDMLQRRRSPLVPEATAAAIDDVVFQAGKN
jgi:trimethylamine--corrinoid protein Co-methyltransferase